MAAFLPGPLAALRDEPPQTLPGTAGTNSLSGLRPVEVSRHFDSALEASINGGLQQWMRFRGVGAGVGEELFFSGYAQTRLAQRWGAWPSVLVSAALFALVHGDPLHAAFAFAAGVFLGWASLRTGTVRTTLVAHVANNAASLASMALTDPARRDSPRQAAMSLAAGAAMIALSTLALRRTTRPPP